MAVAKKKTTSTYGQINTWKDFIDSFNNPMVTTSKSGNTLYIAINNELTINIAGFDSNFLSITVTKNGSTSSSATIWSNGSDRMVELTVVSSNNVFYIQIKDGDSRRSAVIYEKLTNVNLSGYRLLTDTGRPYIDIKDITISNVDGSVSCKHGQILNFSNNIGYLDYIPCDVLTNAGLRVAVDNNFVSSTPISSDLVYTFGGKNYFALGTNTLIELEIT